MADDFRVTVELNPHADTREFERVLAAGLGSEHEVTRTKSILHVYADDERTAERVCAGIEAVSSELAVEPNTTLERWNPGAGQWQDPRLPIEELEELPGPDDLDFDSLRYEVVVRSADPLAKGVEARLSREGSSVFARGRHRLWAGASTEKEARELVDRLRLETPTGSTIKMRPLTRRRRWLVKEWLVGGYAAGGGGDWGGGDWGGGIWS